MSTNSVIGIRKENGDLRYIYCHWDGYPSSVGLILHSYYSDKLKLYELLKYGNISSLNPDINSCVFHCRDLGMPRSDCKSCLMSLKSKGVKLKCKSSNLKLCNFKYGFYYLYIYDVLSGTWEDYKTNFRLNTLELLDIDYSTF